MGLTKRKRNASKNPVAAWGISRMLSDNPESRENESFMKMKMKAEPSYTLEGSSQGIITWRPPPEGRLKLNTDGTCHPDEDNNNTYVDWDGDSVKRGPAGYGGILRDHNGEWVRGFIGYIGVTDSQTAELHGIHKGLVLLDKHGLTGAILETDCQGAFQWVTRRDDSRGKKKSTHDSWDIIKKCRELADKNNITITLFNRQHAKKRVNKCADKLADIAIEKRVNYKELMVLPNEICDLVSEDAKFC
ncbi:polynucleotidyl transferase, ribonuclease H-like superfamily protein 1 [Tanacetum coccineum]